MRKIVFIGYVAILVLMAVVMGCGTENPICTDAFCIVSRESVEGDVTEIDNAKVLALIDTLAVDTPDNTGPLAEIVADTEAGGTAYLDETITTTVTISADHAEFENKGYITIIIPSYYSEFYITDAGTPANMDMFRKGWHYDVRLKIYRIRKYEEHEGYQINSLVVGDYADITEIPPTPINVTLDDVVSDVVSGGFRYLGKTVKVDAFVNWVSDSGGAITISEDGSFHDTVSFFIFSHDDPVALEGYENKDQDTFTVFIDHILPPDVVNDKYAVYSEFIELQ